MRVFTLGPIGSIVLLATHPVRVHPYSGALLHKNSRQEVKADPRD